MATELLKQAELELQRLPEIMTVRDASDVAAIPVQSLYSASKNGGMVRAVPPVTVQSRVYSRVLLYTASVILYSILRTLSVSVNHRGKLRNTRGATHPL
jgi:hypothetical protein